MLIVGKLYTHAHTMVVPAWINRNKMSLTHTHTQAAICLLSNFCFILFQRKEYVKYAKVFPLSEALDFKVPSKWYRRTVGTLEIICGLAMAFIPSSMYLFITLYVP
jgi:hypothetical protein